MAAPRKPKVEMYWSTEKKSKEEMAAEGAAVKAYNKRAGEERAAKPSPTRQVVNWRLVGANGEVMCQSTQGFRDKTDALRSINACSELLYGIHEDVRRVGPGRKPS